MTRSRRPLRSLVGSLVASVSLAAVAAGGLALVPALDGSVAGAQAAPTIAVGPTVLPANQTSTVSVSGAGYLVPGHAPDKHVFGGVYVLFGWVAPGPTWGPSNRNATTPDGQYGVTYTYAGERSADTRDDGTGTNRFVSFTAGGISGESTAFHMQMENPEGTRGRWATTLTIHGSSFQWLNPATGQMDTVNCQQVQCGVFTIGAHGVTSRTNELFTPITFSTGGAPTVPTPTPTLPPSGGGAAPTTAPRANAPVVTQPGSRTPTTSRSTAPQTTTTVPAAVAGETTIAGETTVPMDTTIAPTTSVPDSDGSGPSTTRRDGSSGGSTESAGRVIVFGSSDDDDGGMSAWVWGTAVGLPAAAAAGGVVIWRRRRPLI